MTIGFRGITILTLICTLAFSSADVFAAAPDIKKPLSKIEVSKQSISTVKVVYYDIDNNEIGNGSGFIVSPDGQVVTNYHIIDMVPKLKVITSDNKTYEVLGVSAYSVDLDLAVLKLKNAQNLPAMKLGNSDDLKLGEDVVAIGYPLGLAVTVSFGNISSIGTPGALYRTSQKDIQITAPISYGNSGGPLLNMYGEVIGINYSSIVKAQNINYSIPVNDLKPLLDSKRINQLPDIITEVYTTMDYSQYAEYLYYNFPDKKSENYVLGFSDIIVQEPAKYPEDVDVYLDMDNQKYAEILLAEFEGNKQEVENWLDDIYKNVKARYPNKNVYLAVTLNWSFNTRPEGYSDDEAYYNSDTNKWEIYRMKIIFSYKNNSLLTTWY